MMIKILTLLFCKKKIILAKYFEYLKSLGPKIWLDVRNNSVSGFAFSVNFGFYLSVSWWSQQVLAWLLALGLYYTGTAPKASSVDKSKLL